MFERLAVGKAKLDRLVSEGLQGVVRVFRHQHTELSPLDKFFDQRAAKRVNHLHCLHTQRFRRLHTRFPGHADAAVTIWVLHDQRKTKRAHR